MERGGGEDATDLSRAVETRTHRKKKKVLNKALKFEQWPKN